MNIALFYYDGFAEFEVVLLGLIFRENNLISIALENREYKSEEHQRFLVDQAIKDVDVNSIDLLVIPGGDPKPLVENQELKTFIESVASKNKKIAGICGGASLLAAHGMLKGKRCTGNTSGVKPGDGEYQYYEGATISDEHVVVDGNIITGQGQAYVEFAVELGRQMGLYESQEEYDEGVRWFKNIR